MAKPIDLNYSSLSAYIDGLYEPEQELTPEDYQKILNFIIANGDTENQPRDLIQIRRGMEENVPFLAQGELAFTLDSEELLIGGLAGNVLLNNAKQLNSLGVNVLYPPKGLQPVRGDGVTDDTTNLQAIANYCIDNDLPLIIPPNAICFITRDLNLYPIKQLSILGEIKGVGVGIVTVEIGGRAISDSLKVNSTMFNINKVSNATLKVSGLKNGLTNLNYADHFLLWADGGIPDKNSMAYSRFLLGNIQKLEFNSQGINEHGIGGWINENVFIGGRIKEFLMDGNYPHNCNIFYKPFLEVATMLFNTGSNNVFRDVRLEGLNNITFESKTYGNQILKSYIGQKGAFLRGTAYTSYVDRGTENIVGLEAMSQYEIADKFNINIDSQNYSLQDVTRNEKDLSAVAYRVLYETGLIEIKEDFGFEMFSDVAMFRVQIFPFDVEGNPIKGEDPNLISAITTTWDGSRYITNADSKNSGVAIFKNTNVKYVKIMVSVGSVSKAFKYLNCFYRVFKGKGSTLNIPLKRKHKVWSSNATPNGEVWNIGDIVYNSNPSIEKCAGWICTNNNPVTWKPYGAIL